VRFENTNIFIYSEKNYLSYSNTDVAVVNLQVVGLGVNVMITICSYSGHFPKGKMTIALKINATTVLVKKLVHFDSKSPIFRG
jgi:hypothetical protein